MAQAKDIQERVLWVIQSQENQKSGGGTDLRILQWVIDGKPTKPAIEKRDWYLDPQGDRKIGKAKGMGAGDLYLIIKNVKAIGKLLEIKPQYLDEALQLAMYQDDKPKGQSKPDTTQPPAEPASVGGQAPDVKF